MQRMFGVETEYAFCALAKEGVRIDWVAEEMFDLAHATLPSLPDLASSGLYLSNGARFYPDCGGHPEMSTPECTDPWSLVRYVQAGDRIVASLAEKIERGKPTLGEVMVTRCNVDYGGTGSSWGSHESYLHRTDPRKLSRQIIPHLVSRIVFTGAGGFDNRAPGLQFLLSPRVPHLVRVVSNESMHTRGIFHTKDEPLCGGGYRRLHVLCGEALCSEASTWLRVATTALVVCLAEAGVDVSRSVQLTAPLGALRAFAADPTCRATASVAGSKRLRAIDIQRHYLEEVERRLGERWLPAWAGPVCARWRATLARLEHGAEGVATELDWAIKLVLFRRHCERRGFAWEELHAWNEAAACLGSSLQPKAPRERASDDLFLGLGLEPRRPTPPRAPRARASAPTKTDLPRKDVERFVATARELFELDTRFGQLGPRGLFSSLDRAGLLDHHVEGVGDVDAATRTPPRSSRAKVRGAAIAELAGRRGCASADWQSVRDLKGRRWLDLSDPFAEEVAWQEDALPPMQELLFDGSGRGPVERPLLRDSVVRARIAALIGRHR